MSCRARDYLRRVRVGVSLSDSSPTVLVSRSA